MSQFLFDDEILAIKSKLEDAKRRVNEFEIILKYLEDRQSQVIGGLPRQLQSTAQHTRGLSSKLEFKPTLPDLVKGLFPELKDREFNVPIVFEMLYERRPEFFKDSPDKTTKSKISAILASEKDKKVLEMTFRGKGNIPHRYKVAEEMQEDLIKRMDSQKIEDVEYEDIK